VRRIAPVGLWSGPEPVRPRYLDEIYLTTPAIGLDRVRMELGHLGERTVTLLREAPQVVAYGTRSQLDALSRRNEDIDDLHREILAYLSRLYQQVLTVAESEQVHDYLASANYIETIGNMVESELIEVGRDRIRSGLQLDAAVQDVSGALVAKVTWTVDRAVEALVRSDRKMAREVVSAKAEINLLATAIQGRLVDLLDADDPDSVETFRIRSQVVEYLKRVYYIAKRIAKLTADRGVIQTKEVIARPRRNPRNPATARRRAARKDPGSAEPRSP
jgi:phosphate:Na+ symporter